MREDLEDADLQITPEYGVKEDPEVANLNMVSGNMWMRLTFRSSLRM
jgi:hypothetical protein